MIPPGGGKAWSGTAGIRRQAAFPGVALLDQPDFPAVIVPGFDDPGGKIRIDELRFMPDCVVEAGLGPGVGCPGDP